MKIINNQSIMCSLWICFKRFQNGERKVEIKIFLFFFLLLLKIKCPEQENQLERKLDDLSLNPHEKSDLPPRSEKPESPRRPPNELLERKSTNGSFMSNK